ncbi:hypothetical protein Y032_0100g3254 [Ancylostoma ceylanicum]|uniref:Uncharacterized protein n=1 Tax=Ancylostoma ceylanicum TaxID=53326 RepID=A0A016TI18_9BILA|nr:hypothetical protein Y032_0100g3254 [Ancylostoma ceylanicum]
MDHSQQTKNDEPFPVFILGGIGYILLQLAISLERMMKLLRETQAVLFDLFIIMGEGIYGNRAETCMTVYLLGWMRAEVMRAKSA